jgi:hypothetical protein
MKHGSKVIVFCAFGQRNLVCMIIPVLVKEININSHVLNI